MSRADDRDHLLTHAAAMGGWLSASYMDGQYAAACADLVLQGLMVETGRGYNLTPAGTLVALDLAATR